MNVFIITGMTRRGFLTGVGTLVGSFGLAQALPKASALSSADRADFRRFNPTSNSGDLYQITRMTFTNGVANIDARRVSLDNGIPKQEPLQISLHADIKDLQSWSYGSFLLVQTPENLKKLGIPIANSNPSVARALVDYEGQILVSQKPLAESGPCIAMWREVA